MALATRCRAASTRAISAWTVGRAGYTRMHSHAPSRSSRRSGRPKSCRVNTTGGNTHGLGCARNCSMSRKDAAAAVGCSPPPRSGSSRLGGVYPSTPVNSHKRGPDGRRSATLPTPQLPFSTPSRAVRLSTPGGCMHSTPRLPHADRTRVALPEPEPPTSRHRAGTWTSPAALAANQAQKAALAASGNTTTSARFRGTNPTNVWPSSHAG